jgi:phosphate transport system substrate-binding protein
VNVRVTSLTIATAVLAAVASVGGAQELTGAGSTFAYPLYSRWASDYAAKTGVRVNYQSIGSGGGIRQFSEMTVDFGGTDAPMTDDEISKAKGGPVLHIPVAMGADVIVYNLPSVTKELRMSPAVIADIFLGKVTKWNDKGLAALNPGVALPNDDILVVHRSDGSGTTYIWTDYLTAVSPAWAAQVGKGKDVKWPVGLGGKGNEGVAGQVKQLPGSIGYVELAYARQNHLAYALVQNSSGNFVAPTIASVTAAAAGVAKGLPANTDFRVSIINAPGKDAYPISSMTWALVYARQADGVKGKNLVSFLRYGIAQAGQAAAEQLDYAPLPRNVVKMLEKRLAGVQIVASK